MTVELQTMEQTMERLYGNRAARLIVTGYLRTTPGESVEVCVGKRRFLCHNTGESYDVTPM